MLLITCEEPLIMSLISLTEYPVRTVLNRLLQDKTTKKNIIFATDTYSDYGAGYNEKDEITADRIATINLKPRVEKEADLQRNRTRVKAEVFTPSWVCNKMNNHCDEEWFKRSDVFNYEGSETWTVNPEKVEFSDDCTWKDYVDSRRIEITCGEAPYMVSRYDTTTGHPIEISARIGILDRKMRVINENAKDDKEWLEWAIRAFQSVYGFEFQGDSLLIARINMLNTFVEYYKDWFNDNPDIKVLRTVTNIITWNFWQMDGITCTIPLGSPEPEEQQITLFDEVIYDHNDTTPICRIFDWRSNESIKYTDLKKGK